MVRTNAPPLPGLTCWNSTILKVVPSTSMWVPFLNWLVEITRLRRLALARRGPSIASSLSVANTWRPKRAEISAHTSTPRTLLP